MDGPWRPMRHLPDRRDAKRLHDEGKSVEEIKEFIDNKYKGTES